MTMFYFLVKLLNDLLPVPDCKVNSLALHICLIHPDSPLLLESPCKTCCSNHTDCLNRKVFYAQSSMAKSQKS